MKSSLRILSTVGVLAVVLGCEGKQTGTSADAESGKTPQSATAKTGDTRAAEHKASTSAAETHPRGKLSLRAEDDGTDLDLKVGQVVTIVLDSNHANGLNWIMVDPPGTAVVLTGNPSYAPAKGASGGTETWRFRAAKVGRVVVRLEYGRPQGRSVPEKSFRFTATVR